MSSIYSSFTRLIRDLLAPPGDICLTCGSRTKLTREWPGICRRCAEVIPWIGSPRCFHCGRAIGCPDCMRPEALQRFFVMNRSAVRYDGMMREWLAQYKYRGHERYAPLLVKMLSQALIRMQLEINSLKGGLQHSKQSAVWKPDLITFVPVSKARLIERGFNQAQIFAEGLGKLHHIPIASLLVRSMHTEKQSFKTRAERIESMKGAFELIPEEHFVREIARLKGFDQPGALRTLQILIVDDIYTTGSTLNTCAYVLRQAAKLKMGLEANIYCLTWARS